MKVQFKYQATQYEDDKVELIMTTQVTISRNDIEEAIKQAYDNYYDPIRNKSDIENLCDIVTEKLDKQLYQSMDDQLAEEIVTTMMINENNLLIFLQKILEEVIEIEEDE